MSIRDQRLKNSLKNVYYTGKIKIAKLSSNLARTTAAGQFMKNIAGSLTNRIGDTNLGIEVKVHTDKMKLDANGTRSTELEYGGAILEMKVDEEGNVHMDDLLNNDSALQKKLDGLDLKLNGFGKYVSECESFVSNPDNISKALDTENLTQSSDSNLLQSFQKNIKKSLFSIFFSVSSLSGRPYC